MIVTVIRHRGVTALHPGRRWTVRPTRALPRGGTGGVTTGQIGESSRQLLPGPVKRRTHEQLCRWMRRMEDVIVGRPYLIDTALAVEAMHVLAIEVCVERMRWAAVKHRRHDRVRPRPRIPQGLLDLLQRRWNERQVRDLGDFVGIEFLQPSRLVTRTR